VTLAGDECDGDCLVDSEISANADGMVGLDAVYDFAGALEGQGRRAGRHGVRLTAHPFAAGILAPMSISEGEGGDMNILGFAASSSRSSINKALVTYAARLLEGGLIPDVTVEIIDLNDYEPPLYSIDRQNEGGIAEAAQRFYDKIGAADGVLVSFAEHNGSYTAAFKNLYDWTSRIDRRVYRDKPTVMLSTSNGSRGGHRVLDTATTTAPYVGADLRASVSIPHFADNFDLARGELTNPELRAQLEAALAAFA
jgi:NAD(P)H-dependent FMN reductase